VRRLLFLAAWLLASPLHAAWSSVGSIGSGVNNTGAATTVWTMATTATLESGNVGVCAVGKDESNAGTTDGNGQAEFTSVADDAGNTWVEADEFVNSQAVGNANGAAVAVYYTVAASTLTSGANITFTTAGGRRQAAACWEFAFGAGSTIAEAAGENGLANDAADPGSMTVATGVAQEHLFLRGTACETNNAGWTEDADYTNFTHTNATDDSGTAGTSMGVRGSFRIASEATSAASNPTWTSADCASYMVGLNEVAAVARLRRPLLGVGR
jgi:hypothetical protein